MIDPKKDFRTVPCMVCDKELDACSDTQNHPSQGTAWITKGHFGSCYDYCDDTQIEMNICNACCLKKADTHMIRHEPVVLDNSYFMRQVLHNLKMLEVSDEDQAEIMLRFS